ncbi:Zinc knuckle CX2CX4HX4C [Parasponia andersonii]|uniref:Zinc knuckle CX2CX4HX4C n=1 Tax=Parasponia andersonii TaxID=3476 RepID=A0A2P5BNR9_PARAD|nr:Zinc knuckle CX2CX4HX4C [Parasponia andersonii]
MSKLCVGLNLDKDDGPLVQIGLLQDVEVVGGSMQVHVKIDVTTPLRRGICCFVEEIQGEVSLIFRHEGLSEFCFFCGVIGHRVWDCLKRDMADRYDGSNEKFRFLIWLKASFPRSRVRIELEPEPPRPKLPKIC